MRARALLAVAAIGLAACPYERPSLPADLDAADASPDVDAEDDPIDAADASDGPIDAADAPVDTPIDTPIDAPSSDTDGDGVPNTSDNCPNVVNPRQSNEDGDAFGDVCDLCPHVNDGPMQATNTDDDGIGDACGDPIVTNTVLHCIVWFDGFQAAATLGRYEQVGGGGGWQIAGGTLAQPLGAADVSLIVDGPTFRRPKVMTRATIEGTTTSNDHAIGVVSHVPPAATGFTDGFAAELVQSGTTGTARVVVTEVRSGNATTTNASHPAGYPIEIPIDLALDPLAGANVVASAVIQNQAVAVTQAPGSPPLTAGQPGVRTRRTSAAFNYLLIADLVSPGPCPVRFEP